MTPLGDFLPADNSPGAIVRPAPLFTPSQDVNCFHRSVAAFIPFSVAAEKQFGEDVCQKIRLLPVKNFAVKTP